jgi:hypothetical protein
VEKTKSKHKKKWKVELKQAEAEVISSQEGILVEFVRSMALL